jgi:hypothetical protein
VLTIAGLSHAPTQMWDAPCAMQVAAAFVEAPTRDPAAGPAGTCLATLRVPTFKLPEPTPGGTGAR